MPSNSDPSQTTGEIERPTRSATRRAMLYEKRQSILQQKHTESLPQVNGNASNGKNSSRTLIQLREENKRLHWELEDQQRLLQEYKAALDQYEKEIQAIHSGYRQELDQYQNHLRDMMQERNEMQDAQKQLEQRYQELYHNFQNTVEEEANRMVAEAAQTLILTPEHLPEIFQDVAKTLEFRARQSEDQHIAEALTLIRQAQAKAQQLEQELHQERQRTAAERQNLIDLQKSVREQATLRYKTLRAHLQARYTTTLMGMGLALLLILIVLQTVFFSLFKIPLTQTIILALVCPIPVCAALSLIFARLRTNVGSHYANKAHKGKTDDKKAN